MLEDEARLKVRLRPRARSDGPLDMLDAPGLLVLASEDRLVLLCAVSGELMLRAPGVMSTILA